MQSVSSTRTAGFGAFCDHDGFASGRTAGKIAADQRGKRHPQERPMMEAVAISSSSSAIDTSPETEYGSSSGFSEYFSKME